MVGVVVCAAYLVLFCPSVLGGGLGMLTHLGWGCSEGGWSLRLFVAVGSSSDISKSPQLVICEKEMSKRARFVGFVDFVGSCRACWFGLLGWGIVLFVIWFGGIVFGGLFVVLMSVVEFIVGVVLVVLVMLVGGASGFILVVWSIMVASSW